MKKSSIIAISFLALIVSWTFWRQTALASPSSGSSTTSPTTVYDGVISVAPGDVGSGILELGSSGSDIASSSDIYVRPERLSETNAVRFSPNGKSTVHLYAYGGLCLGGLCRDTWPAVSGGTFWNLVGGQYVEPATLSQGVTFTKTRAGGGAAMEVFSNNTTAAAYISNVSAGASAAALTINGPAYIGGDLNVTASGGDEITLHGGVCQGGPADGVICSSSPNCSPGICAISDYRVWWSGNDGRGSGLDASKLDGIDLDFKYNISNSSCNSGSLNCLCGQFPSFTECLKLQ